jgi:hypothetical protein
MAGRSYLGAVGRVDCIQLAGLVLRFYSNDHLPPHFHAEKPGEWEVVVRFLRIEAEMIELKWGKGPSGRERAAMTAAAAAHRGELHVEWELKVLTKAPGAAE